MIVVRNNILPFGKKYAAINICGVFFVKKNVRLTPTMINHERIHTAQMTELLVAGFYLAYVAEWMWLLIKYRGNNYRAYSKISHEREAYANESDTDYLKRRRHYAQWRHTAKRP